MSSQFICAGQNRLRRGPHVEAASQMGIVPVGVKSFGEARPRLLGKWGSTGVLLQPELILSSSRRISAQDP